MAVHWPLLPSDTSRLVTSPLPPTLLASRANHHWLAPSLICTLRLPCTANPPPVSPCRVVRVVSCRVVRSCAVRAVVRARTETGQVTGLNWVLMTPAPVLAMREKASGLRSKWTLSPQHHRSLPTHGH